MPSTMDYTTQGDPNQVTPPVYVMHQQDRLLLSQLHLTFPSSMDRVRNQNRSKLPHPLELDNRTPPATSDRAQFDT